MLKLQRRQRHEVRTVLATLGLLFVLAGCGETGGSAGLACKMDTAFATVDDYQLATTTDSTAVAMANDSSGNLFVTGAAKDSAGNNHWVVRKSTDKGATWATVDDFVQSSLPTLGYGIAITSAGIFVSGFTSTTPNLVVRKSTDGGTTWTTAHLLSSAMAIGVTADTGGNLYVGALTSANGWVVRKSTDAGTTWANADAVAGSGSLAMRIGIDILGNLLAVGYVGTTNPNWRIRRSTDGGTTWTQVDDLAYTAGQSTYAQDIAIPIADSTFYSVGYGNAAAAVNHWLVRKSTDSGATWAANQDYQLASGKNSMANAAKFDAQGAIYVGGFGVDASNVQHGLVQKSTDGGTTWTVIEDYARTAGQLANIAGLYRHPSGHLFWLGQGNDSSGKGHWVVRKLACL